MGRVAKYTLLYYFTTTMGAVVLGITVVNVVRVSHAGVQYHVSVPHVYKIRFSSKSCPLLEQLPSSCLLLDCALPCPAAGPRLSI